MRQREREREREGGGGGGGGETQKNVKPGYPKVEKIFLKFLKKKHL